VQQQRHTRIRSLSRDDVLGVFPIIVGMMRSVERCGPSFRGMYFWESSPTNSQRITFRRLVRWKKGAFLAQLEQDLYHLFLSQDSGEAWRLFHEHSSPLVITSTEVWGQYAASLYTVPGQPPLPDPLISCPQTCAFFTTEMVKKAIDRMRTRRTYDHDGLVA